MSNKISFLILCIFCTGSISAQSLERSVIGSYGSLSSGSGIQLSSTVGEAMVSTEMSGNIILNQGFQQASGITTNIYESELHNIHVSVYPNPTLSEVSIELSGDTKDKVLYSLYDANGRLLFDGSITNTEQGATKIISLQTFKAGEYFLHLMESTNNDRRAIRLVKL